MSNLLISVDTLDSELRVDQWYGFNDCLIRQMVDDIYAEYLEDKCCVRFKKRFQRMAAYKGNKHAELVFLWMVVVGLKVYEKKAGEVEPQLLHQNDLLKRIELNPAFCIRLRDLRDFLLEHGWPLPSCWFGGYLFSTDEAKRQAVDSRFDEWSDKAVVASRLEARIEDWKQMEAPTVEQEMLRKNENKRLEEIKRGIECQAEGSGPERREWSTKKWVADADLKEFVERNIRRNSVTANRRALLAIMIARLNEKAARNPEYEFDRKHLQTTIEEVHKTLRWVADHDGRCNARVAKSVKIQSSSFKEAWRKGVKSGLADIGKGNAGVRSRRISEEIKNPSSGEILYIDQ